MPIVDLGETWSSPTYTVEDVDGTPTNAGTVTADVTLPDGTVVNPGINNTGPGLYSFDYLTTVVGRHDVVVTATGGVLGSLVRKWVDSFDVDATGGLLVSVQEALDHLRAQNVIVDRVDLEQLRWLCSVATEAVERDLNRAIVRRSLTTTFNGGRRFIRLTSTPVISITTVVENGITLSATDYVLDPEGWLLWRGTGLSYQCWARGFQNIDVTYDVGYTDPPRIARKVALNGIERMWQASQQTAHPQIDQITEAIQFAPRGVLTPLEMSAYQQLRAAEIA